MATGKPVCVVHIGIKAGADEIDDRPPDFSRRVAKCGYCRRTEPSRLELPFFVSHPDWEQDEFFCGCRGWD